MQTHIKFFLTFSGKNVYSAPEDLNTCIFFNVLNNFYKTHFYSHLFDRKSRLTEIRESAGVLQLEKEKVQVLTECFLALEVMPFLLFLSFATFSRKDLSNWTSWSCLSPPGFFALHSYDTNSASAQFAPKFCLRHSLIVSPSEA